MMEAFKDQSIRFFFFSMLNTRSKKSQNIWNPSKPKYHFVTKRKEIQPHTNCWYTISGIFRAIWNNMDISGAHKIYGELSRVGCTLDDLHCALLPFNMSQECQHISHNVVRPLLLFFQHMCDGMKIFLSWSLVIYTVNSEWINNSKGERAVHPECCSGMPKD